MKKNLILLLLVISFSAKVFSQSYEKFPNIVYPDLDGTENQVSDIFSKKELSIVLFWTPIGMANKRKHPTNYTSFFSVS